MNVRHSQEPRQLTADSLQQSGAVTGWLSDAPIAPATASPIHFTL
jgi:hypothetical protein